MSKTKISNLQQKIISVIEDNHVVTPETICESFPSRNKSTIYRNIDKLESYKLIRELPRKGKSRLYEMNDTHHHHIICKQCDLVAEIGIPKSFEYMFEYLEEKFADTHKFKITDHIFDVYGLCVNCK